MKKQNKEPSLSDEICQEFGGTNKILDVKKVKLAVRKLKEEIDESYSVPVIHTIIDKIFGDKLK